MKKVIFLLTIIFTNLVVLSQETNKWEKISVNDFAYDRAGDTSVHAVVLKETAYYRFDVWREEMRMFIDVHRRVLILDEKGLKYGSLEIPYIDKEKFEEIISFSGRTYNINKKSIKKTKIKSKNISDNRINNYYNIKSVKFSNVKAGSIIDYQYTIASLEIVKPRRWNFQHEIPCLFSHVEINLPECINYQLKKYGKVGNITQKEEVGSTNIDFMFNYVDPIPSGNTYDNRSFSRLISMHIPGSLFIFEAQNQPALPNEKYVDCQWNYQTSLGLNLTKIYENMGLTYDLERFAWKYITQRIYQTTLDNYQIIPEASTKYTLTPDGYIVFSNELQEVPNRLNKNPYFGLQLIKALPYKPILSKILNNEDNEFDKMLKIYSYVKNNYEWNGQYGIYTSIDLDDFVTEKKGNSAAINLWLIYLLRNAKLAANPVISKVVETGHIDVVHPVLKEMNSLMAAVRIGEKTYYLDAKNKNSEWYAQPKENLNGKGLEVKMREVEVVDITNNAQTAQTHLLLGEYANSKFSFKTNSKLQGYNANEVLKSEREMNSFFYENGKIENLKCTQDKINKKDGIVEFSGNFEIKGNKFSLSDIFDFKTDLLASMRVMPVYFGTPYRKSYILTVPIPQGVNLSVKPINKKIKAEGAEFSYQQSSSGNLLYIKIEIDINRAYFSEFEYDDLRLIFIEIENLTSQEFVFE